MHLEKKLILIKEITTTLWKIQTLSKKIGVKHHLKN